MLPFTAEVLFAQFEEYNLAIWPAQLIAFALGCLALALIFKPSRAGTRTIGTMLATLWLWTGVAWHGLTFATINFAAPVFAAVFVLEALLLVWLFVARSGTMFAYRGDMAGRAGLVLMLFALAVYPLLAYLSGHGWPQTAMFGVAPGPTVIFTLGVLLPTIPRVPWTAAIIPLLWAFIGAAAAWELGIHEDLGLGAAGAFALAVIIGKNVRAS